MVFAYDTFARHFERRRAHFNFVNNWPFYIRCQFHLYQESQTRRHLRQSPLCLRCPTRATKFVMVVV